MKANTILVNVILIMHNRDDIDFIDLESLYQMRLIQAFYWKRFHCHFAPMLSSF